MAGGDASVLCLFDVDGTLTAPRLKVTPEMEQFLQELRKKVPVALVGGSDLKKISEQMVGEETTKHYDYVFSENGLVYHKNGELIAKRKIQDEMGEEKLQKFINFALKYMSGLDLPVKRGTFVEFRDGLINICPVGRSCSQAEREQFNAYDQEHHIREKFVAALEKEFPNVGLKYSIGGQISFDVFPIGWDKTYCLRFLENDFKTIHFFGDKTSQGGNDYEIFVDKRVIGHTVTSPDDTKKQLQELFFK